MKWPGFNFLGLFLIIFVSHSASALDVPEEMIKRVDESRVNWGPKIADTLRYLQRDSYVAAYAMWVQADQCAPVWNEKPYPEFKPACDFIDNAFKKSGLSKLTHAEQGKLLEFTKAINVDVPPRNALGDYADYALELSKKYGDLPFAKIVAARIRTLEEQSPEERFKDVPPDQKDRLLQQMAFNDKSACEYVGNAAACYYATAPIEKTNQVKARQYLTKACARKFKDSCEKLASIDVKIAKAKGIQAANAAKAQKEAAERQAADDAQFAEYQRKQNSKECKAIQAKMEYCQTMLNIRILELQIEHQRKIGKETGFVDAKKMNDAASGKIILQSRADSYSKEHTQLVGRSPASADCQISDIPPLQAKINAPLIEQRRTICGQ